MPNNLFRKAFFYFITNIYPRFPLIPVHYINYLYFTNIAQLRSLCRFSKVITGHSGYSACPFLMIMVRQQGPKYGLSACNYIHYAVQTMSKMPIGQLMQASFIKKNNLHGKFKATRQHTSHSSERGRSGVSCQ